jgi:hypothetical protein
LLVGPQSYFKLLLSMGYEQHTSMHIYIYVIYI